MEQGRSPLGFLMDLVSGGYGAPSTAHDSTEMYAEFEADASTFGGHELEGLITRMDRYGLTLCVDGRIYDVMLRSGTAYHPSDAKVNFGTFVRVHGSWSNDGFHANTITRIA
jgi:hypothetical protein